ncbi:MAG: glutaminyl-tRNA synthase (glutamine-hydrolyzing) subunit B [Chloroflexi bacterium RBG_16_68_14]|nr:MAG: glutaminyl-tRNA synthase (glutamine-hydrolyzing) subunit B [Chloroflexi bacterium RBG_16_68_14]
MTTPTATKYEVIIGIEVHAQLLTKSKMFCSCAADYHNAPPNTHVCPVCLGMPGVLPVINQQAVEYTIMTGLALNCTVPERAKFDRKNYPYPDLMKGYQISQYDLPLCIDGWLEIDLDGETKRIGITRVHLEEDTARNMHRTNEAGEQYTMIDVNRSGVPLMEIVSEPDVRSGQEARLYLTKLQQILRYLGVSRANMEEGNMRCEPNISLRPVGHPEFGTKVELKNLNSFRAVELGIDYEIERQRQLLDAGEPVVQETRGWRDEEGRTVSQRGKEYADDYRYFPEPDLPPLTITPAYAEELRARLPELPDAMRQRFVEQYALSHYEANLLTATRARAGYFEQALAETKGDDDLLRRRAKTVANWMLGDFARLLNAAGIDIGEAKVPPRDLHALIELIEEGTVSTTGAKGVFEEMFRTGKPPREVVEEQGLTQISAADELTGVIEQVIAQNPKAVADYRSGKEEAIKFLVGRVMRETRGRAKPDLVPQLLREQLAKGQ